MKRVSLKIDQPLAIGLDIRLALTDIDASSVRMTAAGRVLGGPNDGQEFEKAYELAVGTSVHLGPHVMVTLVAVLGDIARLDVFTPVHVSVGTDE